MTDLQTYKGAGFVDVGDDEVLDVYDTGEPTPIGTWEDGIIATYRFLDTDGSIISSGTCKDGETPVAPTDPTKTGYTFNGWDKPIGPIYVDTDYTAQWTINYYTITLDGPLNYNNDTGSFVTGESYGSVNKSTVSVPYGTVISFSSSSNNGSTIGTISFQKGSFNDSIILTSLPDTVQYRYDIAYYDAGTESFVDFPGETVTGNMTLEGFTFKRGILEYAVSLYDDGNGTVNENVLVFPAGTLINFTGNQILCGDIVYATATPSAGYEFSKWTLGSTSGETLSSLLIGEDVEVYANFQQSVNYFTLTANTGGSTVKLTKESNPTAISLEKSSDGVNWTSYTIDEVITLANPGDKLLLRNANENGNHFSDDGVAYYYFVMTGSIAASGDITHLITKNGGKASLPSWCFYYLFKSCSALTSAPELPSTTMGSNCYGMMFYQCTGLVHCPVLPATTLATNCYKYMFRECSNLEEIPAFYATTYPDDWATNMYQGCSKIYFQKTSADPDTNEYRIPMTGTGTGGEDASSQMIYGSGMGKGIYQATFNTTYYTRNTIVGIQR